MKYHMAEDDRKPQKRPLTNKVNKIMCYKGKCFIKVNSVLIVQGAFKIINCSWNKISFAWLIVQMTAKGLISF